eukprot:scaffold802_cov280-Pinguiococcus_pyrenoidosus.AAC.2
MARQAAPMAFMMSYVVAASRPVEISSAKTAPNSPQNISPVVTRLRWPPDTPRMRLFPMMVCSQVVRPSRRMRTSTVPPTTSSNCLSVSGSLSRSMPTSDLYANSKVSRTVSVGRCASR